MSIEPCVTTYVMRLAPDLDDPRALEVYAGEYDQMCIDDACVSQASDGLSLFFTIAHPHMQSDVDAIGAYLNRFYQRNDPATPQPAKEPDHGK
jgi:hypothetical protein